MTQPTAEQLALARECAVTAAHSARFDDEILSFWTSAWSDMAKGIFEEGATQSALLAIQATEARAQGLVDALEAAQNLLSNSGAESGYCCCGDPVSSHSIGSGHAPVDSHGYYAEKCCQNIDQALATWRRT